MSLLQALKLSPPPARAGGPAIATRTAQDGLALKPAQKRERLAQAATGWRQVHRVADQRIDALKKAIKSHYSEAHPALLQEIEKGVGKLDGVLDNVDHRLADVLASAGKTDDDSARKTALANARALLTQYVNYVKSEPLIAHMDHNPFGVKTDLRTLLAAGLTDAAKAIG
ncbi:MAG: hypothetical protein ABI281_05945 [Caldimonas sp.]